MESINMHEFMDTMPEAIRKAIDNKDYLALHIGLIAFVVAAPIMWIVHFATQVVLKIKHR